MTLFRNTFLCVLVLALNVAMGQNKKDIEYFDDSMFPLKNAQGATFYRTIEENGDGYLVKVYRVNGDSLHQIIECSQVSPKMVRHGKFVSYFRNGNVELEGVYDNDKHSGTWKTYHKNGIQAQEIVYRGEDKRYIQHWSSAGKPMLVEGTGEVVEEVDDGAKTHYTVYRDSILLAEFSIRHELGDTLFYAVEEMASYRDGFEGLYRELGAFMKGKYPKKARRMGVEGRVYVQFVVSKKGRPVELTVLRGIGAGCDEVALEGIQAMTAWTPARYQGKAVQQLFVLPVVFRLN
jgi:TonB family protein